MNKLGFIDDIEKMKDFRDMPKDAFLMAYSYITEEEYEATLKDVKKPNIGQLEVYWVTICDDKYVIEELSLYNLVNTISYFEEENLEDIFISRKDAEERLKELQNKKIFQVLYVQETAHKLFVRAKDAEEAEKIAEAFYYGQEEDLTDEENKQFIRQTEEPQDNTFCECIEVQK